MLLLNRSYNNKVYKGNISKNCMVKMITILVLMLVFLTGFLSSYAANSVYIDTEKPFLIGFVGNRTQPSNWLSEDNIVVYDDRVVIYVNNAELSKYADTGSMLPVLGEDTTGIKIKPENPEQINVGDIITYQKDKILIVHRVVGKGEDEKGIYFITKGDNNNESDGKVYFEDVKYVTLGLVY